MSSWLNMLFGLESLAPSRGSHVITRAGGFFSQNPPKRRTCLVLFQLMCSLKLRAD